MGGGWEGRRRRFQIKEATAGIISKLHQCILCVCVRETLKHNPPMLIMATWITSSPKCSLHNNSDGSQHVLTAIV